MKKEEIYFEPADFIPEELRKKYGIGEYFNPAEESEDSTENEEA